MKKKALLLLFVIAACVVHAQTIWTYQVLACYDPYDYCLVSNKDNDASINYPLINIHDSSACRIETDTVRIDRLTSFYNDGRPTALVSVSSNGALLRSPVDSLPFLTAADTVSLSNRINAISTAVTINNNVSRSLSNSTGSTNRYTISSSKNARVNYSITINWSVTALLTSSGTVYMEYSTDSGTSWTTVSQVTSSVSLGLTLSGSNDMNLSGDIPANALVRLRTTTTNATCTYVRGQEVLY